MRFGSVCSGIEAASVAWHPLGWRAAWLAEIEPFPSAVLAHHYPDVPNLGDMTRLPEQIVGGAVEAPDIFCGGTPCQAFSVAGLRRSLDDARGNLSLVFCEIANAIDTARTVRGLDPAIVFWENVPGVLSTKDNAFGCFLAGLAGEGEPLVPAGGKWPNAGFVFGPQRAVAWRVLDAQYFGVAQRRRRVFVVASARNDFDPATVLFEFDGVRRDSAPSREAGQGIADAAAAGTFECGGIGSYNRSSVSSPILRTGSSQGNATVAVAFQPGNLKRGCGSAPSTEVFPTLAANHGRGQSDQDPHVAVAVSLRGREGGATAELGDEVQNCLRASSGGGDKPYVLAPITNLSGTQCASTENLAPATGAKNPTAVAHAICIKGAAIGRKPEAGPQYGETLAEIAYTQNCVEVHGVMTPTMQVRRLTPVECERLQGFPDGYTAIPWRKKPADECPEGPRYKALGNSWAVPVVRWIGQRIAAHTHKLSGETDA